MHIANGPEITHNSRASRVLSASIVGCKINWTSWHWEFHRKTTHPSTGRLGSKLHGLLFLKLVETYSQLWSKDKVSSQTSARAPGATPYTLNT